MYFHDDGYGGYSYDDTPDDDEMYGEDYQDYDYYDYSPTPLKTRIKLAVRSMIHRLRMRFDAHYRDHLNDIPF